MAYREIDLSNHQRQLFVGDDPGKEGWISWIDHEGNPVGQAPRPSLGDGKGDTFDRQGYKRLIHRIQGDGRIVRWTIEKQQPSGINNSRQTIAIQFQAYGAALGVLDALEVSVTEVRSQTVREAMGVPKSSQAGKKRAKRGELNAEQEKEAAKQNRKIQDAARKQALLNLIKIAQGMWPGWPLLPTEKSTTPSSDMASSRLIAEYGRRTHLGMTMPKSGETA